MSEGFIPLSVPNFAGHEKDYVNEAVVSEWVSSGGSKVGAFEETIAAYVGMPSAVATSSGTAALHLCMLTAGIGPGDEVLAPDLTFIAAINPIRYAGAQPVFLGCDEYLCLDPDVLEAFCREQCEVRGGALYNKTSGRRVAAVEVMHTFGNLCDMARILEIAKRYHLLVIEDATEALGSRFTEGPLAGKMAGSMGDISAYSFNGNKIITTGSGGMLVSNHPEWAGHAKHLSTQAKTDEVYYIHDEVGYNYRLTNLQAALGLAQMEQLEGFIARKKELYDAYCAALDGKAGLRILPFRPGTRPNRWFFSLYLTDEYPLSRDELLQRLKADSIQTRTIWGLIHQQLPYQGNEAHGVEAAQDYHAHVLNLPCSTKMTDDEVRRVCRCILSYAE